MRASLVGCTNRRYFNGPLTRARLRTSVLHKLGERQNGAAQGPHPACRKRRLDSRRSELSTGNTVFTFTVDCEEAICAGSLSGTYPGKPIGEANELIIFRVKPK